MDEETKQMKASLVESFPPINFSSILGFPNKSFNDDIYDFISDFHGDNTSAIHHITTFIKVAIKFNIVHEDHLIEIFASSILNYAYDWFYENLPSNCISSLSDFFYIFLEKWHHGHC